MVVDVADIGVEEPIDLTNEDDEDDDDLAKLLGGLAVDENAAKSKSPNDERDEEEEAKPKESAKIRQLLHLLGEIKERGERTIVFSQFTSFLDLLGPFLKAKGICFVRCKFSHQLPGTTDKQMMGL
jgi:SNF2 family DNA or RNA helicase